MKLNELTWWWWPSGWSCLTNSSRSTRFSSCFSTLFIWAMLLPPTIRQVVSSRLYSISRHTVTTNVDFRLSSCACTLTSPGSSLLSISAAGGHKLRTALLVCNAELILNCSNTGENHNRCWQFGTLSTIISLTRCCILATTVPFYVQNYTVVEN